MKKITHIAKRRNKSDFLVYTYEMYEDSEFHYTDWSDGLNMVITKNGVTLELNAKEIEQLVKSLPRTIGRKY